MAGTTFQESALANSEMQLRVAQSSRPLVKGRLLSGKSMTVRRHVTWLGVLLLVSVSLRLATWDVVADGDHARYTRAVAFGAASTIAVWGLIFVQAGARSILPLLSAGIVLLGGDAIHYLRLAHPTMRGGAIQALTSSFMDERTTRAQWDLETSGGGAVRHEQGALILSSPANGTAFMRAKLGPVPDPKTLWWIPIGIGDEARHERVTWHASVQRTGDYYVVANIKQLLIQVVSYGIHITYPDGSKQLRGHEIQHAIGTDGKMHEWQISRGSQGISVSIDGQRVWSAPAHESLQPVQLGESKADPSHGGTMRLEFVDFRTFLARP